MFCYFTIDPGTPQLIDMPQDIQISVSSSNESVPVPWIPPTVSNYHPSKVNLTSNYAPGHNFTVGTWKVIYTAEDYFQHRKATASFTIFIYGRFILNSIHVKGQAVITL